MKLKTVYTNSKCDLIASTLLIIMATLISSCSDFLNVELPGAKVESSQVYSDDAIATSAVRGIYSNMYNSTHFASGSPTSVTVLAGLSADELVNLPRNSPNPIEFNENNLTPENTYILGLWTSMYQSIYQANAVIEGLSSSSGVSLETHDQLTGEALFIRAFGHFYLVNLFGNVPLIISTDYPKNSVIPRTSEIEVYGQIVNDLIEAQNLLGESYIKDAINNPAERARPNKFTAKALLSRVYLYLREWQNAETLASEIIANTSLYNLPNDLNKVFLKNGEEAIWQLAPAIVGANGYVNEAYFFTPPAVTNYNVISSDLVTSFEADDRRLNNWIGSFDTGTETIYYPFKYKQNQLGSPITEYSMVFRLAEQILIRAEARAQLGHLSNAIADLDMIRGRAGLPLIVNTNPSINQNDLLLAIAQERRVELFAEWGHRWFDLKRTGRASKVLKSIKSGFTLFDELYPIPHSEFNSNPKLGDQNPGY